MPLLITSIIARTSLSSTDLYEKIESARGLVALAITSFDVVCLYSSSFLTLLDVALTPVLRLAASVHKSSLNKAM